MYAICRRTIEHIFSSYSDRAKGDQHRHTIRSTLISIIESIYFDCMLLFCYCVCYVKTRLETIDFVQSTVRRRKANRDRSKLRVCRRRSVVCICVQCVVVCRVYSMWSCTVVLTIRRVLSFSRARRSSVVCSLFVSARRRLLSSSSCLPLPLRQLPLLLPRRRVKLGSC